VHSSKVLNCTFEAVHLLTIALAGLVADLPRHRGGHLDSHFLARLLRYLMALALLRHFLAVRAWHMMALLVGHLRALVCVDC